MSLKNNKTDDVYNLAKKENYSYEFDDIKEVIIHDDYFSILEAFKTSDFYYKVINGVFHVIPLFRFINYIYNIKLISDKEYNIITKLMNQTDKESLLLAIEFLKSKDINKK